MNPFRASPNGMQLLDEDTPARGWSRAAWLTVMAAAVLPFLRTLTFGYVMDDTTVIRSNPALEGWAALGRVWMLPYGGLEAHYSGLYRPVTMVLFATLWNAGGHWPLWFHLLAVALHALAAVLVWRLLSVAVARPAALLGALWFALHPVHVESVANVANSSEVLVAVFTCALALHLRRSAPNPGAIGWPAAAVAGLLYAAAFLSKESGATAALLAFGWVVGWRARPTATTASPADVRVLLTRWWRVLAAFAFAAFIVFLLRSVVLGNVLLRSSIAAAGLEQFSAPARMWAMLALAHRIVALLLWPTIPNPHYGPTAIPSAGVNVLAIGTLVALAVVLAVTVRRARRGDARPLVAVGWTLVAFIPASNFFVATGQVLAERTLYVPSIGVAMLLAWLIDTAFTVGRLASRRWVRLAAALASAALLGVFAARSSAWSSTWRSNAAVFSQMIVADPAGYRGYWLAGLEARYRGRPAEAVAMMRRAHELYPRDRGLVMDYSAALTEAGDAAGAAVVAAELMTWPELATDPFSVGLYLRALDGAYGPDSVAAAARRLMQRTPSATAADYLERALAGRR